MILGFVLLPFTDITKGKEHGVPQLALLIEIMFETARCLMVPLLKVENH